MSVKQASHRRTTTAGSHRQEVSVHGDRKGTGGCQGLAGGVMGVAVRWAQGFRLGDEKALEVGGGDGCLTILTYSLPLNGTRKNG